MKEPDKRAFLNFGRHRKSIVALATAFVVLIGFAAVYGDSDLWDVDLPFFVDTFDEIEIDDSQIPLSQQQTTTSRKVSKKSIKLKKKATKTYTKNLPKKVKTTTSTRKTDKSKIVKKTTVKVEKKDRYTRHKKTKLRTTTTTTTVVTTTYKLTSTPATENKPESTSGDDSASSKTTVSIRSIAPKASSNVLSAYESMGFKVTIDSSYTYSGCFDARERMITLRKKDDNVYHELGHFVAFVSGNTDVSSAFKSIYNEEKSKYDGRNSSYVLGDSSEYFAESYRDYILYNSELKSKRPKTYEAIRGAISKVCEAQVERLKSAYADMWS